MRQAGNWLIIGSSGSGKSYYLDRLLAAYAGRYRYLVVINTTSQLAEHCRHREYVPLDKLGLPYDPAKLADLIRRHGSVHFELAPGDAAEGFLDRLGQAVMLLGEYETAECRVLVVMDEARYWVKKGAMPAGLERCEAEGRKFGVDIIKATQRLGSTGADTVDLAAVNQITRLVVFPMAELNLRERVQKMFPELPDPSSLRRPDPAANRGGEYLVWDCLTNRGARIELTADGRRACVPLNGAAL
ncbi:MAG TPA: hypothetical protein VHN99_12360 [Deinococcales bacterium]|nr:hypothetical protein [Deinococcales bacterium]